MAPSFNISADIPGLDRAAVSGLTTLQYQVPNVSVEYVELDVPIPCTYWRSVGSSQNGFTVESFMDEVAHAAGQDPVEFRLRHLRHDHRSRRVLELAAEKSGWGRPLSGEVEGRGVAVYYSYGTYWLRSRRYGWTGPAGR